MIRRSGQSSNALTDVIRRFGAFTASSRTLPAALSLLLVFQTGWLAGCTPPPKKGASHAMGELPKDGGKPIPMAQPDNPGPYRTVDIDGAELLQARGKPGRFGGAFFDTQIGDGPKTFNYFASYDNTSSTLAGMMLSGLMTTDAYTGESVPYLAKDVAISDDKLTYTVTLRKGLQWSDGKPLTSRDVVFTWNEIIRRGLGNPSSRDVLSVEGHFPEVTAIDDLTIRFKTAKPFAPFLRMLSNPVAPAHIFKPMADKGSASFSAFWGVSEAAKHPEKFVSNGMWLLESYDPRLQVTFKRNPKFFMVDKKGRRLPYLDRYVIRFVGDMNNEELQFEQGKSDTYTVPGNFVSRVRKLAQPKFRMVNLGPATGTMFLTFNLNRRKNSDGKPYVDPVHAEWFNDIHFRQAVNHAINRNDIVSNILKGVGAPLFTAESLSSIYLNEKLAEGFPTDLSKSKTLLKQSGFHLNANGRLLDRKNHPVEFTLYTNSGNTERESVGVNIQQDLSALGIKVNFKPIDFNVLVKMMNEGTWEAIVMGLTGDQLEPNNGANVWKSDGGLHLFNQRIVKEGKPVDLSDRLPWEKTIDDLFNRGVLVFDFDQRKKVYDEFQQVVFDQAPMIYLYSPLSIVAVRERIQNFDPTPLGTFHNLEEIWIDDPSTSGKIAP